VQVAPTPSLALSNSLTFEAWIKPRTSQCNTILSRGDGTNIAATDYIFQVGTDGTNCGVMKLALMIAGGWATSASTVPLNAWSHVAVSYDGIEVHFYINGVLDRSVTTTGSIFQSGSPLFIGRQGSAGGNYFDGTLDEVRVWNTTRSAVQVRTNLNRLLPNTQGLAANWSFDEGGGNRAVDFSGRGRHGTLVNRPMRVISFWAPAATLNGPNPLMQECHTALTDPGLAVTGRPVAVTAGVNHSLILRSDGSVRGWGLNANGQTNVPEGVTSVVAIAAGHLHGLALKADGSMVGWGPQISVPEGVTNTVAIAAGHYHSMALKADGSVVCWGENSYGQTNVPPGATNIVAIAAGGNVSLAARADGTVIGWGENSFGQCTPSGTVNNVVMVATGGTHSLGLRNDGQVYVWGNISSGQGSVPNSATNLISIAAGDSYSLALRTDGVLFTWGRTDSGLSNIPAGATNVVAIEAGVSHSLAVRADGSVFAWGNNAYNQVEIPIDLNRLNFPVSVRGSVNPDLPENYVLNYSTTNTAGAVGIATRTVTVTDTTAPILAIFSSNPLNLDVGTPFSDPGATASDACEGNLTSSIVRSGTVNTTVPGAYTLTYGVTDSSGNTTTTNRTVLVRGWPTVLGFTAFFSGTNAVTGSPVAQFLADVNPNGLATVAFAQYGLNTAYPGRTASVNLPASYNTSTFFATLDGLVPGATYHFRVAASNSLGVTYGPDQTFTVPTLFAAGDLNGDGRVNEGELNNVLSNYWLTSPSLVMTNPSTLGAGLFQFALTNVSGWNMSVFASTNLTDWELLPSSARPVWQFLDPAYTNYPQRFYRLQWP